MYSGIFGNYNLNVNAGCHIDTVLGYFYLVTGTLLPPKI